MRWAGRASRSSSTNPTSSTLTTRRYDEEDVRRLGEDRNVICWQARLTDAFGAHGMIAVVVVRMNEKMWFIDTWLQSCRVLQRGVEGDVDEPSLSRRLAKQASKGWPENTFRHRGNGMVADFYTRLGFSSSPDSDQTHQVFFCNPQTFKPLESYIDVKIPDTGEIAFAGTSRILIQLDVIGEPYIANAGVGKFRAWIGQPPAWTRLRRPTTKAYSTRFLLCLLLAAVVLALPYVYATVFTDVMAYDDQGALMITLRDLMEGRRLYNDEYALLWAVLLSHRGRPVHDSASAVDA